MIRYKETIQFSVNSNDEIRLQTDMGQFWLASIVKERNPFGVWLTTQHTRLRETQRDYLHLIHQAYSKEYDDNPMNIHWVYQRGKGYNSASDVALGHIPTKNIWVLMTSEHTWIQEASNNKFVFRVSDASDSIMKETTQDQIWDFSDYMKHGRTFPKKKYRDEDYVAKGLI